MSAVLIVAAFWTVTVLSRGMSKPKSVILEKRSFAPAMGTCS